MISRICSVFLCFVYFFFLPLGLVLVVGVGFRLDLEHGISCFGLPYATRNYECEGEYESGLARKRNYDGAYR